MDFEKRQEQNEDNCGALRAGHVPFSARPGTATKCTGGKKSTSARVWRGAVELFGGVLLMAGIALEISGDRMLRHVLYSR